MEEQLDPMRRKFLSLACGSAAFYFGLKAATRPSTKHPLPPPQVFEKKGDALGTQIFIRVLHENESLAHTAIQDAFAAIENVECVMSLYRPDSQLVQLNRTGRLENPHPDLLEVLRFSRELSEKSGDAFDVTVQPLWNIYSTAARSGGLPSSDQVKEAKTRTGWQHLEISTRQLRLTKPGMAVTLNGVAQGFAADKALETLRDHGIEHALVDSGEFGVLGTKTQKENWRVGIQHPREPDQTLTTASLESCCLSTSGDYETFFTPDFAENHIFDPRTGHSPRTLASVSVRAPSGLVADGLSTALFVLGKERGTELLQEFSGTDAYFVDKKMRTSVTPGFPKV